MSKDVQIQFKEPCAKIKNLKNTNILLQKQKWIKVMIKSISKSKVKNYLFMKYHKNIQSKVFQEKIFKNL